MELQRSLARPGVDLAYRITPTQRPSARAVLLLHGLASNLTRWSEFVEHTSLAGTHPLIRVDLRGHGDSPTRGPIGIDYWCDDLMALLQAEAIDTAILVGHSLGAQVALQFAARHPERMAGLVLIDPVFRVALSGRWRWIARAAPLLRVAVAMVRLANALGLRRRRIAALDLRELDRQARVALQSPEAEQEFIRQYSSTRADLRSFRTAHYLQELIEMFRPLPPPQSITAPALVLLSSGATFADLDTTRAIAARFPRASIQTIDCHHWPLTERPAEVRTAIEWFVGSLPAAGGATLA